MAMGIEAESTCGVALRSITSIGTSVLESVSLMDPVRIPRSLPPRSYKRHFEQRYDAAPEKVLAADHYTDWSTVCRSPNWIVSPFPLNR